MSDNENFKEHFDYSFLRNGKSFGRINLYSNMSEKATLVLPNVPGSRFCGEDRPDSEFNDTDIEVFKESFDYSFLNEN